MKSVPLFFAWLALILAYLSAIAAYFTHVVACIKTASWILLAFGLLPPIGVIHGIGIWFGWFL